MIGSTKRTIIFQEELEKVKNDMEKIRKQRHKSIISSLAQIIVISMILSIIHENFKNSMHYSLDTIPGHRQALIVADQTKIANPFDILAEVYRITK